MKCFTLPVITILILFNTALAQNKTYVGLEFSAGNDFCSITDKGDYLKKIPLLNGQGGLNIRQEVSKRLFMEVGVLVKYYQQGFGFKSIPDNGSSSSDPSWLIPVRTRLKVNLHKSNIYLIPVIGYTLGINPPYGNGFGYGTITSGTTSIQYDYAENPDVSRYFSLLQAGIGVEMKLFRTVLFSIATDYYKGFSTITQLDINYSVNNASQTTGTAIGKGDFWCVSVGLKYPISNFWQ